MRTIRYRGYNEKNKCWLYGNYIRFRGKHFICEGYLEEGESWEDYEIEPHTLDQYTEFNDRKGQPIYESDKVLVYDRMVGVVDMERGKIIINYYSELQEESPNPMNEMNFPDRDAMYCLRQDEIEIIGNIYKNIQQQ